MEIPYEVTARRDTGLYNAKIGIWLFLASEVMLFGGLFSAYVFLRVGVDPAQGDLPWPTSVQKVWIGFANTLVLIASSVFVVLSWVELKQRNWRKFQFWMGLVIACAATFMVLKSIEYKAKFTHTGIVLTDGSVIEGEVIGKTNRIEFEADSVTVNLLGGVPGFVGSVYKKEKEDGDHGEAHGGHGEVEWEKASLPGFTDASGQEVGNFKSWFLAERAKVKNTLAANKRAARNGKETVKVETSATLKAKEPFTVLADPHFTVAHGADSLAFRDVVTLNGKLVNDTVSIHLHEVDLQMVPFENQKDAQVWTLVNNEAAKTEWFEHRNHARDHIKPYYDKRGLDIPRKKLQDRHVSLQAVHLEGEGEHAGVIEVPRDAIRFISNHGPRYNVYYAIYFTMTGLHGLHVLGGALVLAYMMFFGKKLYLKNPEHMANRVEVGGLFWHFVDLVWIFLFPIMYLF
ncbi:MAG: heme-copper oxidase subunit III [Verrucomicrobiae bacterium]|nr:heme-copper oxidase subunit III [Verrucomicrobiae bacterium]MCP5540122.1 heme-copper oxidase subunit III [Akkermansiaceae bacterium]